MLVQSMIVLVTFMAYCVRSGCCFRSQREGSTRAAGECCAIYGDGKGNVMKASDICTSILLCTLSKSTILVK